jgi:hypothetical protein
MVGDPAGSGRNETRGINRVRNKSQIPGPITGESLNALKFAFMVRAACTQFKLMEGLIRQELRLVSTTGEDEFSRVVAIMALAQSFVFHVNRAYRICRGSSHVLSGHRDRRKAFLKYIENKELDEVRNVIEHQLDPHGSTQELERFQKWLSKTGLDVSSNIVVGSLDLSAVNDYLEKLKPLL